MVRYSPYRWSNDEELSGGGELNGDADRRSSATKV
jgi:hypothetical protein